MKIYIDYVTCYKNSPGKRKYDIFLWYPGNTRAITLQENAATTVKEAKKVRTRYRRAFADVAGVDMDNVMQRICSLIHRQLGRQ